MSSSMLNAARCLMSLVKLEAIFVPTAESLSFTFFITWKKHIRRNVSGKISLSAAVKAAAPQNRKADATGRQLCRLLPRTELNPTH